MTKGNKIKIRKYLLVCAVCENELEILGYQEYAFQPDEVDVRVSPCETCLEKSYQKGINDAE